MTFVVTHPGMAGWFLLLPVFWALAWRGRGQLSGPQLGFSVGARTLAVALVVLALAGLARETPAPAAAERVIFLVDGSRSMRPADRAWVRDTLAQWNTTLGTGVERGLVVFGRDAVVVQETGATLDATAADAATVQPDDTDLARGLVAALEVLPESGRGNVVVLSDGNETIGRALDAVEFARAAGARVFTLGPPAREEAEVAVTKVVVPDEVKLGDTFDLAVLVENRNAQPVTGTLTLREDATVLERWRVRLEPGTNRFQLPYTASPEGPRTFQAEVQAQGDTRTTDNVREATTHVLGRGKILYVSGHPDPAPILVEALTTRDLVVVRATPETVPDTLEGWLAYDAVLFSHVARDRLADHALRELERYVQEFGGGFVMLGGEESFGQGGYAGTPVERLLPVTVHEGIPYQPEASSRLSMVLVIDRSSSMYGEKLTGAKASALALVQQLEPDDRVGVVAFDARAHPIVGLRPVREVRGTIIEQLRRLQAGGGTNMFPGMAEAVRQLTASRAKVKHIVLMSDGKTMFSGAESYGALLNDIQVQQITISTIALGGFFVNTKLLKGIAEGTGGQFYRVMDAQTLPSIVVQDAERAVQKTDVIEEHFFPKLRRRSEVLAGIFQEQLPPLKGYTITRAKDGAEVPLIADVRGVEDEDPILATWRTGLGKVLAFTSDAEGRWSSPWIRWAKYHQFWSQAIRWTMRERAAGEYDLDAVPTDDGLRVRVERFGPAEPEDEFALRRVAEGSVVTEVALHQVAPRQYEARVPWDAPGASPVQVVRRRGGVIVEQQDALLIVSPEAGRRDQEGDALGPNTAFLQELAARGGGRYQPGVEDVRQGAVVGTRREELAAYLLPLALGCFLVDVAVRRLPGRAGAG